MNTDPLLDLAVTRGLLSPDQAARARGLAPDDLVARGFIDRRELETLLSISGGRRVVAGRYEILEEIGRGGMGVVFKCRDKKLDRVVALKGLPNALGADIDRFEREARMAAALKHPNIVPVHDFGRERDQLYLTMDYIAGNSFDRLLESGVLDRRQSAAIVQQIAEALLYAHRHGVVHRDVKPENIIVDAHGRAHLTDFGLARRIEGGERLTITGMIVGTPSYMSPEQAAGKEIDARSDIYSLGASLYKAITGALPHTGESAMDVAMSVLTREPPRPRTLNTSISLDLETICLKAMERDPARRYASAGDMAEDVARFLRGDMIRARPPSLMYRATSRLRKNPAVFGAAATAAVALAVAVAMGWSSRTHRADAVAQLRTSTDAYLESALALRRVGDVEGVRRTSSQAELLCRRVIAELPDLAEPHYRLGRIYRAQMRFDEALAEQEAALAKDPAFAPARYERAVLNARRYRARLDAAERTWLEAEGAKLKAFGGHVPHAPSALDLEAADAALRALGAAIVADVEGVRGLDPARAACAEAILAVHRGRPAGVEAKLRAALAQAYLEEAYEALVEFLVAAAWNRPHDQADDAFRLADTTATEACDADRGYAPHRESRARARLRWANYRHAHGQPVDEQMQGAIDDLDAPLARADARFRWASRTKDPERYRAAEADYTLVLESEPANAKALTGRATVRLDLGLLEAAMADSGAALAAAPGDPDALQVRALVWGNLAERSDDPAVEYARAVADCDAALASDPIDRPSYLIRGDVRVNWGRHVAHHGGDPEPHYRQAVADYTSVIDRVPGDADAHARRAAARLNWGSHLQNHGGDPTELYAAAEADLKEAMRHNPRHAQGNRTLANVRTNWAAYLQSRGKDPTEIYERVIADAPDAGGRAKARLNLAFYRQTHGLDPEPDYRAAEADLADRRDADGLATRSSMFVNWGWYVQTHGRDPRPLYEKALADAEAVIALDPRFAEGYTMRANARMNLGLYLEWTNADPGPTYAAGIADCDAALKINPADVTALRWRGQMRSNWGMYLSRTGGEGAEARLRDAVADADAAVDVNPTDAELLASAGDARTVLGWYLRNHGGDGEPLFAEALAMLDRAIDRNPNLGAAYADRGNCRYYLGHWEEACADYQRASELDPSQVRRIREKWAEARERLEEF